MGRREKNVRSSDRERWRGEIIRAWTGRRAGKGGEGTVTADVQKWEMRRQRLKKKERMPERLFIPSVPPSVEPSQPSWQTSPPPRYPLHLLRLLFSSCCPPATLLLCPVWHTAAPPHIWRLMQPLKHSLELVFAELRLCGANRQVLFGHASDWWVFCRAKSPSSGPDLWWTVPIIYI